MLGDHANTYNVYGLFQGIVLRGVIMAMIGS